MTSNRKTLELGSFFVITRDLYDVVQQANQGAGIGEFSYIIIPTSRDFPLLEVKEVRGVLRPRFAFYLEKSAEYSLKANKDLWLRFYFGLYEKPKERGRIFTTLR